MPVDIVMRSYNDMPLVVETLDGIGRQAGPFARLSVFDNASSDGTEETVRAVGARVFEVPQGEYVPGKVLNRAMRETDSPIVVFVNSDCTPVDDDWLRPLLAGFEDDSVAAVFGRQMAREDCRPLFVKDTEATYGDGALQANWRHCFSMASSAVRRSVWEKIPFDEDLGYSEDIDWTWRVRQAGYAIRYVPESKVFHSHNYSLKQYYRRQYGEGRAEAEIFSWTAWQTSCVRYSLLPLGRLVLSDWRYCLRHGHLATIVYAPILRTAGMLGRRRGFRLGLREKNAAESRKEAVR